MDENKFEQMYNEILSYETRAHERNQRRIKAGIVCIFVIPLAFLVLMFLTDSSKPVFLTLWIASLYAIATYLIAVEYNDHKLQKNLARFRGEEDAEVDPLIGQSFETVEETLREARAKTLKTFNAEEELKPDEEHT